MSWWVYLVDQTGEPVKVARHSEGGTHTVGGTDQAELNVTYNYSGLLHQAFGMSFREALNGKKASEVLPQLRALSEAFPDAPEDDYWVATPGNVGHMLAILRSWAQQYPEGVFEIS